MKHTPGPWIVSGVDGYWAIWNQNTHIATINVDHEPATVVDDDANAKLISAAPELLEACQHGIDECMRAYKITAKLETQDHEYGAALNELIMRLNEVLKAARAKATGGAE